MTAAALRVVFHGTRGSIPVSGPASHRYGGNTICVEVRCGDRLLIFDAGSGLPPLGLKLKAEGAREVELLFTHVHYDHIMGLPYFAPLYDPAVRVRIWGGHLHDTMTAKEMVAGFMRPPYFPVGPEVLRCDLEYRDFRPGDLLQPYEDVALQTGRLNHPGGAVGYRLEFGGRVLAIVTDTEHRPDGSLDPEVLALIDGADLALYDASYVEAEMEKHRGFGHSTWQQGVRLARAGKVARFAFIHHAPWRTDDELDAVERAAAEDWPGAFCARDRQVIEL